MWPYQTYFKNWENHDWKSKIKFSRSKKLGDSWKIDLVKISIFTVCAVKFLQIYHVMEICKYLNCYRYRCQFKTIIFCVENTFLSKTKYILYIIMKTNTRIPLDKRVLMNKLTTIRTQNRLWFMTKCNKFDQLWPLLK